jgi:hypothetical protein
VAKGLIDPAGSARLQQVAGDLLHARGAASSLAGAMEKAGVSAAGMGGRTGEAQLHVATLAREFRKLSVELKDGGIGAADVTILRLAQHLFELNPAALVATGAVAGLVGGLGYLAVKAAAASNALDHIHIGAEFAGNLDLSRDRIKQFADQMSQSADISSKNALAIADSLARIPGMTTGAMQAITSQMGDFVAESGVAADKVGADMKRMFGADTSAEKFAHEIAGVTQAQINAASAADKLGDANQVMAEKIAIWNANLARASATVDQNSASIDASIKNRLAYTAAIMSGLTPEEVQDTMLGSEIDKRTRNNQLLAQGNALLAAKPQTQEQTLKTGVEVADKENPASKQIEEARAKVDQLNAALEVAESRADSVSVAKLAAGLEKANENLSALQFGPVLDQWREKMAQTAAAWDGTQSGLLAKQIEISQGVLANVQQSAKEQLAVKTEIAHLEVQQRQTAGAELINQARAEVAVINGETALGGIQRLEKERDVWVQTLTGERLTAAQRLEVAKTLAGEYASINKETAAQAQAIARSDADTNIAIARLSLAAEKQVLDEELAAHQISASQKLAVLRQFSAEEFSLNLKALNDEISALNPLTAEYERVYNQIRELKAKLVLDLAALDRQGAADAKKAADQEATTWKTAVGEIENAETTMLGDLLSKRKSFGASAIQIAQQLVTKELENDLKAFTTKVLLQNQEKALEQGGLLFHILSSNTDALNTARAETMKTAAVTAGAEARVAATTEAAVSGKAAQSALNVAAVQGDAAKAAAGAYASVSSIPVVGWILAPVAAGVAYAAVSAYESLASFDVGAWNVPHDMNARIHAGETVMPKTFAEGFRENGGQGGQGGGGGGDTTNHFHGPLVHAETNATPEAILGHITKAIRNGHPAFRGR